MPPLALSVIGFHADACLSMNSVTVGPAPLRIRESGAFLLVAVVLLTAPAVVSLYLRHYTAVSIGVAVFMLAVTIPFSSLLVVVRDQRLLVQLGGLITVRNVALSDIEAVTRFRPPSLAGIGIRWLAGGTLYTVTLGDAVEIRLTDGTRFYVGSDAPDAMCAQVRAAASIRV